MANTVIELGPHCPSSLLKDFHDSLQMGSPLSKPLHNWFEVPDCCAFTGVECNKKNQIQVIELVNMNLSGFLLSDMGGFKHLYRLVLLQNNIHGQLPSVLPPKLIHFNIERNAVSGPIPPYESKIIKRLILSGNHLSGPIPLSFCEIEELRALHLSSNRMVHGMLPSCLSSLSNLHTFRIRDTSIVGPIPESLCDDEDEDGYCSQFDFCRDGFYHSNANDTNTTSCDVCQEDRPSNVIASSACRLVAVVPTEMPSLYPSDMPSLLPSVAPSIRDTFSVSPTISPSRLPSIPPSPTPSHIPSPIPSTVYSLAPSMKPVQTIDSPSSFPTMTSASPSFGPSVNASSDRKPFASAQGGGSSDRGQDGSPDRIAIYIPIMFLICLGGMVALYMSRRSRNRFFAVDSQSFSQGDDGVRDSMMESGIVANDSLSTLSSMPPPPPPVSLLSDVSSSAFLPYDFQSTNSLNVILHPPFSSYLVPREQLGF